MRRLCYGILIYLMASAGCMHRGRDKIVYLRPDYNALNRLSFQIDKYSHQPPRPRHVDHYRWMYNKGPIDHTLLPELYTHQPITQETLVTVAAETEQKELMRAVDADQWQWSTSNQEQDNPAPTRMAQPTESDIQLLSGGVKPAQIKNPERNQTTALQPVNRKSNWIFTPVPGR